MDIEIKGAVTATSPKVSAAQRNGEQALRGHLGVEEANALIANRVQRDGDKAHITLARPPEMKLAIAAMALLEGISKSEAERRTKTMAVQGLGDTWRVKGLGRAKSSGSVAYFLVLDFPDGKDFRRALGLDPDGMDFHLTVGFGDGGDVFDVPKTTLV